MLNEDVDTGVFPPLPGELDTWTRGPIPLGRGEVD